MIRFFKSNLLFCLMIYCGCVGFGQGKAQAGKLSGILFSSNTSDTWQLWRVNPDGRELRQLTFTSEDKYFPVASPDRNEIAYTDTRRNLRIIKADGASEEKIPLPAGIYAQPAWSPTGNEIAYVKYKVIPSDQGEIWLIRRQNSEWGEPQRITASPPMRLYPSFSPDGSKLAFAEFRRDRVLGVTEEICLINLSDRRIEKLTDDMADNFQPRWSPRGNQIAYTSNKSGNYDIWLMSVKDRTHRQLTRHPAYDGDPSWSPNGEEIAFVSTRSGNKEIWVISVIGDRLRQITNIKKTCKDPFWVK